MAPIPEQPSPNHSGTSKGKLERAQKRQQELYDRNRYKTRVFLRGYRVLKQVAADIVSFAAVKWSGPRTIVATTLRNILHID
jgi:hypothetical protein